MFVLANLLQASVAALGWIVEIMIWLIIIRALLSWVNPDPHNPIVQFIERSTEWLLIPFRKIIPSYKIGFDLSPIFALIFLQFFMRLFVLQTLLQLSHSLRG